MPSGLVTKDSLTGFRANYRTDADELVGVLMLEQPHPGVQYDFENAVRQAIIE